jgi:hypothetical protein
MMKKITHKFITNIPDKVEEGILYISMEYATAIHKCACGCGNEVVTPFSPIDWQVSYNGKTVSLSPSIGNWNFPCKSHYWITNNYIEWVPQWSKKQNKKSLFGFLFKNT